MIHVQSLAGRPVAVFGLGRSGLATAEALARGGAKVRAWDDSEASRRRAGERLIPLVDLLRTDWSTIRALVLSPGVPLHHPSPHPVVSRARDAGVEIIGDIELLARAQPESRYIGITGTNGKSTTTALIGHIFDSADCLAAVGGNLGMPALTLAPMGAPGTYILEMSSYQLDLTVSPVFDIAVLLNLSADHLDRHGDMAGYIAAKKRIFNGRESGQTAIVGVDDDDSRVLANELKRAGAAKVISVSGTREVPGGVYVRNGMLVDDSENSADEICDLTPVPSLPGPHNGQNAAAAYAVAKSAGIAVADIVAGIRSYPGLAHRQEPVGLVDGVAFVNDSKATNGEAAARAVASYADVYWIAGGRAKEDGLAPVLAHLDHVHHAYLIGEAAPEFSAVLRGKVPCTASGTLRPAVEQAFDAAKSEALAHPVVLLSPACASFDQFPSFEARGDAFKDLVGALPGHHVGPFDGAETSRRAEGAA